IILSVIVGAFGCVFFENLISGNSKQSNDSIKIENILDLQTQIDTLSDAYNNLAQINSELQNENYTLQSQIDSLRDKISEYNSLAEENAALKDQVQQLENKLQIVESISTAESGTKNSKESINNDGGDGDTYIQTTATFVKVRSAPESSSSIIGTVKRGTKILLVNTVKESDGKEWYQILIEDETGYIRSDLAYIVGQ
ncbi:MAG: SH3 domain-containing protein, partial [Acetatifactor sp.]|nr:SH3 domain-containing protein [Acetatifactor sp.]